MKKFRREIDFSLNPKGPDYVIEGADAIHPDTPLSPEQIDEIIDAEVAAELEGAIEQLRQEAEDSSGIEPRG